jgi:predicted RNase H-like HicB family nuclease
MKVRGIEMMNYVVVYEALIREAIEFHLEGLREDQLPIPQPSASAEIVTVS